VARADHDARPDSPPVSRSGEFERIDLFLNAFREAGGATTSEAVPLGPGDDAALLAAARPWQ